MRHPVCHLETEAEYFHRHDAELIDDMRRSAASEERRRRMAEACQADDSRILSALEKLGFDQTNVTLLYFVPLVYVAWIDGSVNQSERNRIIAMATLQGVRDNTPAYQQLMGWLDRRPADEFFRDTMLVIRAILDVLPESERMARKNLLIRRCQEVAFASCALFGWKSKICIAKRTLIRKMSRSLEPGRQVAAVGAGS